MSTLVSVLAAILLATLPLAFCSTRPSPSSLPSLLIRCTTTHGRHLPSPSRHSFSYPLLYLGIDIDDLESGRLNLSRILRWGTRWATLGLRGDGYLTGPGTLRAKVEKLVGEAGKVWLVTMPSYLGFEGINPLSVWYVYKGDDLACVILEVHNTFGEKHAYVLPTDSTLSHAPKAGYDHAWTFPRSFHVSPFNSRDGFYRLDLVDPFKGTPTVGIFLRLLTPDKETKLHATLTSSSTSPLSPKSILAAIVQLPFTLLLTSPRIMWQAYKLHYGKRLAVYPRPDPVSASIEKGTGWNQAQGDMVGVGFGLGRQAKKSAERVAERVMVKWAKARTKEVGFGLVIKVQGKTLLSTGDDLVITTSSCTHLLTTPPPLYPLDEITISSQTLFNAFFSSPPSLASSLRRSYLRWGFSHSRLAPPPHVVLANTSHPADNLATYYVLLVTYITDWIEEAIMYRLGAVFVDGQEPWRAWERAMKREYGLEAEWEKLGSVRY